MAVLEAASYGLPAVLSDIPAHRELAISGVHYFAVGDILALEKELRTFFEAPSLRRISTDDDFACLPGMIGMTSRTGRSTCILLHLPHK